MIKIRLAGLAAAAALFATLGVQAQDAAKTQVLKPITPEIRKHISESIQLAGGYDHPLGGLFYVAWSLVPPSDYKYLPPKVWDQNSKYDDARVLEPPSKLFDQLYFFGDSYTGAVVLVTSAGIIQWDTMDNDDEAEHIVEAGYRKMGLDPANIKYIILTHGHADHFGGTSYFQRKYPGIHVLESEADWKLISVTKPRPGMTLPKKDMVVTDGMKLILGDTTVSLYVTPGHTPGSVSSIFKVTDNGVPHTLAMFGGMSIPGNLTPMGYDTAHPNAGLEEHAKSWTRFGVAAKAAGVDGVISTHSWADGMFGNIKTLEARQPGDPNPFIRGREGYDNYLKSGEEAIAAVRLMSKLNGGGS
jgi:metallo-beta-lactamase class B